MPTDNELAMFEVRVMNAEAPGLSPIALASRVIEKDASAGHKPDCQHYARIIYAAFDLTGWRRRMEQMCPME